MIEGRRVLITGAGGSIGSELARQIYRLGASELLLLDRDESLLHAIQLELFGDGQLTHPRTILADIRDRNRVADLFGQARPDVVLHAAAHKHLSILERYPSEAVRTNVLGTDNVLRAARGCGAEQFALISTDKAASPTSVLGASKRVAEMLTTGGSTEKLRTASVRFGNVLGSRGSFLHTLRHQILAGRPVTLTDPDAERYFMSIPEAAGLVIDASLRGRAGEIYVLDMGEPVRIMELIERFVQLNNLPKPRIRITGLGPGEKLSEVLFDPSEIRLSTDHGRIWEVPTDRRESVDHGSLQELYAAATAGPEEAVLASLWACLNPTASRMGVQA